MSSLDRYPVSEETFNDTDLQLRIAEEMLVLLRDYGTEDDHILGATLRSTVRKTDRFDVAVEGSFLEHAYRLKSVSTLVLPSIHDNDEFTPIEDVSSRYSAMTLEYGYVRAAEDTTHIDNDYSWQSYVLCIIDGYDIYNPCFVNAQTGAELDLSDLMHIFGIIQTLRDYIRSDTYEQEACDGDSLLAVTAVTDRYGRVGYRASKPQTCGHCSESRIACVHFDKALLC